MEAVLVRSSPMSTFKSGLHHLKTRQTRLTYFNFDLFNTAASVALAEALIG